MAAEAEPEQEAEAKLEAEMEKELEKENEPESEKENEPESEKAVSLTAPKNKNLAPKRFARQIRRSIIFLLREIAVSMHRKTAMGRFYAPKI